MRRLHNYGLERLAEVRDGERPTEVSGLSSLITRGLVRPLLTPAGVFALQTGFAPSPEEVALVHMLTGTMVFASSGWSRQGIHPTAPGTVLSRFRAAGLAQIDDGRNGHRGTRICQELALAMAAAE